MSLWVNELLLFLMAVLATYRVALMVSSEKGPFAAFEKLREWAGDKFPPKDGKQHWIDAGINCFWCVSFWVSLLAAPMLSPFSPYEFVCIWLAIGGGAVVLNQMVSRW